MALPVTGDTEGEPELCWTLRRVLRLSEKRMPEVGTALRSSIWEVWFFLESCRAKSSLSGPLSRTAESGSFLMVMVLGAWAHASPSTWTGMEFKRLMEICKGKLGISLMAYYQRIMAVRDSVHPQ